MTDKDDILAAIAALGTGLNTKIDANHAQVMGLLDTIANGTGRIEATLGSVKADVREIQSSVARIETRLDRHEARIEALEARP